MVRADATDGMGVVMPVRHAAGGTIPPPDSDAPVRLHLLGDFQVVIGGVPVPARALRLRKARSLLKLLALAPRQRLSREEVADALWPDADTDDAARSLRVVLHAARRALAPHGAIVGRDGFLTLVAPGLWIDATAFEEAVAAARRGRELADYVAALDLYGGELLPEDRFEDWTATRRDYLHGLHLTLLLELAALYEDRGDWPVAVAALQRLLDAEPAHEEAHVSLMRVHARAGRRALALYQWDQLVAALQRHLDAAPDEASRHLRDEIAAGHFPPAGEPAGGARGEPRRHNLPIQPTALIGREADLAAVKAALAQSRLLTLTGAGGVGKTRLALAAATDRLAAYPDGVWWVDLAAQAEPAQVPGAVAGALGVREEARRPLAETLAERLAAGTSLLVLDNCEHLRDACASLAAHLLPTCPRLCILATSRAPLGLATEATWRVPSLAIPEPLAAAPSPRALAEIGRVPAARLFVERVRGRQLAFELTPANAAAVAAIARRLDGIPLALELAAARAAILTPEQLSPRLDDALRLLTVGDRSASPRQRTLRATLAWSYRLLDPPQRALLDRLSAFAGGCDLDAVEAVCADDEAGDAAGVVVAGANPPPARLPRDTVLDALAALVEHSLVQAEAAGGAMRYRLLETVRQFAAERLAAGGEIESFRARHAAHYEALAGAALPHISGIVSLAWLDRLEGEHDNFRAALRWLLARGDTARVLSTVGNLWRFWYQRGHAAEGARWCAAALALPGAAAPALAAPLAQTLHGAARLAYLQGDYAASADHCERALDVQQRRGDQREIAALLITLGNAAHFRQRYDEALAHFEESRALAQALGHQAGVASALNGLANVAAQRGDYAAAATHYEASLALGRAEGDAMLVAIALGNLANVVEYRGDFARAEALHRESVARRRELGNKEYLASALDNLGVTLRGRGDYAGAIPQHEEALALWRELGNRRRVALSLTNLGTALQWLGEHDRAQALHEEGLGHARARGDAWLTALTLENLGQLAWERGDRERATTHTGESLALYRQNGQNWGIITTTSRLGRLALSRGDIAAALALYRESLELCRQTRDRSRLPAPLEGLASLLADHGQPNEAARLLAAATTLRADLGKPPIPDERADHERALAALRAALGEEAFAAAWAAGLALDSDAALVAALAAAERFPPVPRRD